MNRPLEAHLEALHGRFDNSRVPEYTKNKPYAIHETAREYALSNYVPMKELNGKRIALLLDGGLRLEGILHMEEPYYGDKYHWTPYIIGETAFGNHKVRLKDDFLIEILD